MLGWRVVAVAGVLALLGACSDTPTGQAEPTESGPSSTAEPQPEPTGPETAQPTRKQPSFEYANAPIGSSPSGDGDGDTGAERCVELDWGSASLPDGVVVRLGAPRIELNGQKSTKVFRVDSSTCTRKGKGPRCNGFRIDRGACFVGVRQVTRRGDRTVTLTISASVTCPTRQVCEELRKKGEGGGVPLTSVDLEQPPPTETPPEPSPSEAPSETPSGDG
jgi:hypothetical protein